MIERGINILDKRKKFNITYAQNVAKTRGGECLSNVYKNTVTKMRWRCADNHTWEASLKSIKDRKSWCPYCYGNVSYSINDCINLAKLRGGKCLSKTYSGRNNKINWQCGIGHKWLASLNSVKGQKSWCPKCAGKAKLSIYDCAIEASKHNGKCMSKSYINSHTIMSWECCNKHTWKATLGNIKSGKWCPKCAKNAPKTIEDCMRLAGQNNGKCLSKKYTKNSNKIKWQCCECNHIWSASYMSIKQGSWCPKCAGGKTQKALYVIIKNIFKNDVMFNYCDFDWLRNPKTNRKLEIDIWVPSKKIAIEYDGEQHFKPVRFGGISHKKARELFEYTVELDCIKNMLIKEHNNDIRHFIRIKYSDKISLDNIKSILKSEGVKLC